VTKAQALEVIEPGVNNPVSVATPMSLLDRAVAAGASMDMIERLIGFQERMDATNARKAFDSAMAAARADIPPILKNREVDFVGKTGIRTHYKHEDLAEIARTVDPILARHGLSYRFRTTSEVNEPVSVTCIVSHRDGHSEENKLIAGRDDSGNKNSIQAIGSTITFLQRYTLKAALGLAAAADDDGKKSEDKDGPISDEQAAKLRKIAEEVGADLAAFCEYMKIESIPDLPASQFQRAMQALEKKRGKK
jgi:hypothetical protein